MMERGLGLVTRVNARKDKVPVLAGVAALDRAALVIYCRLARAVRHLLGSWHVASFAGSLQPTLD
jgi:hypothetical protein